MTTVHRYVTDETGNTGSRQANRTMADHDESCRQQSKQDLGNRERHQYSRNTMSTTSRLFPPWNDLGLLVMIRVQQDLAWWHRHNSTLASIFPRQLCSTLSTLRRFGFHSLLGRCPLLDSSVLGGEDNISEQSCAPYCNNLCLVANNRHRVIEILDPMWPCTVNTALSKTR